jgi:hypothetical protein
MRILLNSIRLQSYHQLVVQNDIFSPPFSGNGAKYLLEHHVFGLLGVNGIRSPIEKLA